MDIDDRSFTTARETAFVTIGPAGQEAIRTDPTAKAIFDATSRGFAPHVHAMHRFCDRVEAGDVRSRRTYAGFCEILGRQPRQ